MEFGGWLKFQGSGWMRRKESSIRNANKAGENNENQVGTSKINIGKEVDEDRGLDHMETNEPVISSGREDQDEAARIKKGKGKLVGLNESSANRMEDENVELNLLSCVEKMANEDSPCGSTTEGIPGGFEVSATKKMNWKRRARLGQVSESLNNQEIRDVSMKKRKNLDELTNNGKRSRTAGCVEMEVGSDPKILAEVARRPCQGL